MRATNANDLRLKVTKMEYRNLGSAGVQVSEIALGNWITHGGQVGADAARSCVEAAFDEGINFFDTADVYEGGKAEAVLGDILKGVRRSSYVLATKVYWPTGERSTTGASRASTSSSPAMLHSSGYKPTT